MSANQIVITDSPFVQALFDNIYLSQPLHIQAGAMIMFESLILLIEPIICFRLFGFKISYKIIIFKRPPGILKRCLCTV